MTSQTGEWEITVASAGTKTKVDNTSALVPLDREVADLNPRDWTTSRVEIMHSEAEATVALHDRRLSSDGFTLTGSSVCTPTVESDVLESYPFGRRARRKSIGGSDMV